MIEGTVEAKIKCEHDEWAHHWILCEDDPCDLYKGLHDHDEYCSGGKIIWLRNGTRIDRCDRCDGTGKALNFTKHTLDEETIDCPNCNGKGRTT